MLKMIQEDAVLRRFMLRNLLWYVLPNLIFNGVIPYYSFKDPNSVYLFQGEFCFARFLLPMALLLPFIITFDIIKKTVALSEKGEVSFVFDEHVPGNRFMFKLAGINGGVTLSAVLLVTACIQLNLPENYSFNGLGLAFVLSMLAGMFCMIFTFLPVKEVLRKSSPRAGNSV